MRLADAGIELGNQRGTVLRVLVNQRANSWGWTSGLTIALQCGEQAFSRSPVKRDDIFPGGCSAIENNQK